MISNNLLIVSILLLVGFNVKCIVSLMVAFYNKDSSGVTIGSWVLTVSIPLNVWVLLAYFTRLLS